MIDRKKLEESAISLAITQTALHTAQQFAEEQITEAKKQQVYLNTLAVWVVNDYLEMMDIATDLVASDSWNSAMRLYSDLADLKLIGLGCLECRPLLSDTCCYIPLDLPGDRLGIVAVKINLEEQEATLLGFTPTVKTGELTSSQLRSFEELLIYLDHKQNQANLSQWWQNIFEASWQPIEDLFTQKSPILAFRHQEQVARGKLVQLGIKPLEQNLALIIALNLKSPDEIQIGVQLYPTRESSYLPENVAIKILDEVGKPFMETVTRPNKTRIKLDFLAQQGESFSLNLEWGETSISEYFVV